VNIHVLIISHRKVKYVIIYANFLDQGLHYIVFQVYFRIVGVWPFLGWHLRINMGSNNLKVDHVWNVGGVIDIGSFNLVHHG
jgi:hypothetical protein